MDVQKILDELDKSKERVVELEALATNLHTELELKKPLEELKIETIYKTRFATITVENEDMSKAYTIYKAERVKLIEVGTDYVLVHIIVTYTGRTDTISKRLIIPLDQFKHSFIESSIDDNNINRRLGI